ncbi:hypothetical protein IF1G_05676 [Cordyceps javanica]|uniref:Uncharacterized protein n=1 Tax=Cordyceps javanica TaxID=43265 RepID=A0A545V2C3_9HYPO|nr:hypothetical protein IF1G_05676 [Cordyceps javanica]
MGLVPSPTDCSTAILASNWDAPYYHNARAPAVLGRCLRSLGLLTGQQGPRVDKVQTAPVPLAKTRSID